MVADGMTTQWWLRFGRMWAEIGSIGVAICPGCAADLYQSLKIQKDADGRYWHEICYLTRRCETCGRPRAEGKFWRGGRGKYDEDGDLIVWQGGAGTSELICPECPLAPYTWLRLWTQMWAIIGREVGTHQSPAYNKSPETVQQRKFKAWCTSWFDAWHGIGKAASEAVRHDAISRRIKAARYRRFCRSWGKIGNQACHDRKWWKRWAWTWGAIGRSQVRANHRLLSPGANLAEMDATERRFAQLEV